MKDSFNVKMSRFRFVAPIVVCCAVGLFLVGGLFASNMGFKIVRPLYATGPNSLNGVQTLALPFVPGNGMAWARDLYQDIGFEHVQSISRYLPATGTLQSYTIGSPECSEIAFPTLSCNFPLRPGEGYLVKMSTDLVYRVVGSHDSSIPVELRAAGPGSAIGLQLVAVPYHSTAGTVGELFSEIGAANVQLISKLNPATNLLVSYTFGSVDMPLIRGEAVYIKMGENYTWYPSHY